MIEIRRRSGSAAPTDPGMSNGRIEFMTQARTVTSFLTSYVRMVSPSKNTKLVLTHSLIVP
jgi:hypothetical protein